VALTAGTTLGPYEIAGPLGAGGMGEVYRARDTRLSRYVAIKVLPAAFAADPDRRVRFEREARVVAALSHPNILAIHDVGETSGKEGKSSTSLYVVTELLEGETLRERLTAGGALPLRKTIEIAVQIANGLAAAHEKNIVHRDLKPENLFLLADGQVKILDFGLARQESTGSGVTETAPVTEPGVVMGTVGYMSPEQVRGDRVDARTDLFALGAVLYEMLSGERAFRRDTAAETMTAILREDPPDSYKRADVSPALDRVVRHCLEKNPGERFQTARDIAFALETFTVRSGATGVDSDVARSTAGRERRRLPVLIAAALSLVLGMGLAWFLIDPAPGDVTYTEKTLDPQWVTNARFAPDGQTIIFSAAATGSIPRLFILRPDAISPEPLGEAATHLLAVSSKGELAVIVGAVPIVHRLFAGTLARMSLDGAARPWMENVREADWSPDGANLAVIRIEGGADRLEYPAGTKLHEARVGYLSDLRVSPDGKKVAFFEHPVKYDNRGAVKVVDERGQVTLLAGGYSMVEGLTWSADGGSVFYSAAPEAGLLRPFVVNVSGAPQARPAIHSPGGLMVLDRAGNGALLVSTYDMSYSIRAQVPGETVEREFPWLSTALFGFLSSDHRTLVFTDESASAGPDYTASMRPVAGGKVVRLGPGTAAAPSPDGRWVPALAPSGDGVVLYPTGPGEARKPAKGPLVHYEYFFEWFPDGRAIVCGSNTNKASRCYVQDVPDGVPVPLTPEGIRSALPSPDSRRLLVTTTHGTLGIVTVGESLPPTELRGTTSQDDAKAWTSDGRGVFVTRGTVPMQVFQIDLATGRRTLVREVAPPDLTGVMGVGVNQWVDDGRGYTYTYTRVLSKLFVATGLKP
jgi:serine/threonine protein kinase